ncbi:MAG: sigma-70 family RNA polymerase sigma factor [Planctomycetota bacterium]
MPLPGSHELQRLLEEEAFVRSLARALAGRDADDVVQGTWQQAMAMRTGAIRKPRPWLARVVQGIASNVRRARARRDEHERAVARQDSVPSSAELMEREERRRRLVLAVDELPEPERGVVLMRYFQDLPPRAIAAELGLPVRTVHARLRSGLSALRRRLDREHGDRRVWLVPLLGPPTTSAAMTTGTLVMTTKTKIVTSLAAVLVLAGVWAMRLGGGSADSKRPALPAAPAVATATGPAVVATDETPAATRREPVAATPPRAVATGSLLVRVRYADEPRPAAGVPVILGRPGGDFRVDTARARTDGSGVARFDALTPGSWEATTGRALGPKILEIRAGEQTECDLDLQLGMTLSGIVVDATGTPVAGALVEVGEPRHRDPEVMATTGADGTFALRGCPSVSMVGARAEGHASSSLQTVHSFDGTPVDVRLELVEPGGTVDGLVVAEDGTPVADAVVRVGKGKTDALTPFAGSAPPLPAQVRTDRQGRFRAIGVAAGTQPVQARAVGFAPFAGSCDVIANATVALRVTLAAGASCEGAVVTADGAPVANVDVRVGSRGDFVQLFARTAADGAFILRDLPVGTVELAAADPEHGDAKIEIATAAGATAHCELRLSKGLELRGRVVDEAEQPVAGLDVWVTPTGTVGRIETTTTGGDGRFCVPRLPEGCRVNVRVAGQTFDEARRSDVDPAAGELLLRVQNPPRSAYVRGVVHGVDGGPVAGIDVDANWQETSGGMVATTAADGRFELGPLRTGVWRLRIVEEGCAIYQSPTLTLVDHAALDIGTIRLHRGGDLEVEVAGAAPEHLGLTICDARDDLVFGMVSTNVPLRSLPLNPGSYALRVHGKGFAAQSVPFTIRDGERTLLKVVVATGISQRLVFRVPPTDAAPAWFPFKVRRDDTVLLTNAASSSQAFAVECWLAPGDYEVVVDSYGLSGSARFSVGGEPGPPVVVPVR